MGSGRGRRGRTGAARWAAGFGSSLHLPAPPSVCSRLLLRVWHGGVTKGKDILYGIAHFHVAIFKLKGLDTRFQVPAAVESGPGDGGRPRSCNRAERMASLRVAWAPGRDGGFGSRRAPLQAAACSQGWLAAGTCSPPGRERIQRRLVELVGFGWFLEDTTELGLDPNAVLPGWGGGVGNVFLAGLCSLVFGYLKISLQLWQRVCVQPCGRDGEEEELASLGLENCTEGTKSRASCSGHKVDG